MQLTQKQRKTINNINGPMMIVAGPGTGKTYTLTQRIIQQIQNGIPAKNILAVTFTNKAAQEIKKRLEGTQLPENQKQKPFIGTFHAVCAHILRNDIGAFGRNTSFTIGEKSDSSKQILTFDDLLELTVELFERDSNILGKYQNQWTHISVDEYQDTSEIQAKLIELLAQKHKNLCIIGDPDQSIYGFRGAKIENFLNFEKTHPNCTTITLEDNFRSTQYIVEASNAVITHNENRLQKTLKATNEKGVSIEIASFETPQKEAYFIVREIEKLIGGSSNYQFYKNLVDDHIEHGNHHFGDFAILYRTNHQSKTLKSSLEKAAIPYQVIGESSPFELDEVKTLLACLDNEKIVIQAKETLEKNNTPKTLSALLRTIIDAEGFKNEYESKNQQWKKIYDQLLRVVEFAMQFDHLILKKAIPQMLDTIQLSKPEDFWNPDANAITLMTVHKAKGLEFPVVFVAGMEKNIFPYSKKSDQNLDNKILQEKLEEERRLFYVAITRAKKRLYLTRAQKRNIWGKIKTMKPSRFLEEIPPELCKERKHQAIKKKKAKQISLF